MTDLSSSDRYALGLRYVMDVELSPLVPKDNAGKPILTEKVFNEYSVFSYIDAGGFSIEVEDLRFDREEEMLIRSDFGNLLGTKRTDDEEYVTIETGKRVVSTKGRSEDIRVHIVNKDSLDSRIAGITQHGRII